MRKYKASTNILIGFVTACVGGYYGYQAYAASQVDGLVFEELVPSRVNLVGIDTSQGYRIRVANQIAQLVEGVNYDFQQGADREEDMSDGTGKRRIPMRELLQTLQGNEKSLGELVMVMNEKQEDETWPPERVYWDQADIEKALGGDVVLREKLESDINMKLDGTPLPKLRIKALENGIIVRYRVPVRVSIKGEEKTLMAPVEEPYKPRMMREVEKQYENKPNANQTDQVGYYLDESRKVLADPKSKENVATNLKAIFSPGKLKELAERPEQVLRSAKVILNDQFVTAANYREKDGPNNRKVYDLNISLTDEGRKRLWAHSRKNVGAQLLLIVDGIAIAAPRINHELSQAELTITQLPDEVLVREAVAGIEQKDMNEVESG